MEPVPPESERESEPRKDPSSDPDWRSDPFWDPQWRPEDPRPVGFLNALGFLLATLVGTLSAAASMIVLVLAAVVWLGLTALALMALLSPTGGLAGSEALVAVTALSWIAVWAWLKKRRE